MIVELVLLNDKRLEISMVSGVIDDEGCLSRISDCVVVRSRWTCVNGASREVDDGCGVGFFAAQAHTIDTTHNYKPAGGQGTLQTNLVGHF